MALLQEPVPYLAEGGKSATAPATVWEHLLAALRFTESHLGSHGLPLILQSDWNDCVGRFARQGRGQTVFAAQQYIYAMRLMRELAERAARPRCRLMDRPGHHPPVRRLLNPPPGTANGGGAGYDDDGAPLGSTSSPFGKLWLNPQSWAVLSQTGSIQQQRTGMDAVAAKLDTGIGLQILTPGFKTYPDDPDPFSGYAPGCGENAAIFCHANSWGHHRRIPPGQRHPRLEILPPAHPAPGTSEGRAPALSCRALRLRQQHHRPPENVRFGFANVGQLTGTAAWMEVAVTQYLLGICPQLTGLRVDPCIPADWRHFEVHRRYRGRQLHIRVDNPHGVQQGVRSIRVDGTEISVSRGPVIPAKLLETGTDHEVIVVMANKGVRFTYLEHGSPPLRPLVFARLRDHDIAMPQQTAELSPGPQPLHGLDLLSIMGQAAAVPLAAAGHDRVLPQLPYPRESSPFPRPARHQLSPPAHPQPRFRSLHRSSIAKR